MELVYQNITDFVQKLPEDIINKIIPFTYSSQSQTLLHDIRNYHNTLQLVKAIYYKHWVITNGFAEIESKWELIADIEKYANNNTPASPYTFIDNFRHIWFRNFTLNNNNEFDSFIIKYNLKAVQTQINMFWGMLTANERNEFIVTTLHNNIN